MEDFVMRGEKTGRVKCAHERERAEIKDIGGRSIWPDG